MNNSILKTIAAIALLIQIVIPVWWAAVFASFYYFWVEGIIEGGILGAEMVIGVDRAGNSIIGNCFLASPCSFTSLLWGLLSVYSIVAVVVPIYSFFYVKKMGS
ncbi:MAG: hypothetical protein NT077_04150, partial [Candidatus Taylorbacteria bacterium]|nr:hypothetical protein [Candidatus Taylorbacteria bacterium]